jgi:hypothetical protein
MEQTDASNNNRLVLLLIAGIPVTMILAASWLWYFVVEGDLDLVGVLGTANQGTLVQPPRQMDSVALMDSAGLPISWEHSEQEPRWVLLVPSPGPACKEACERRLYLTRQIHIAMGKEFNRIGRAFVSDTAVDDTALAVDALSDGGALPADFGELLARDHRGLRVLGVSPRDFSTLFPELPQNPETWYLVDPAGWIMMSYDDSVGYRDVMSDLKFLLKNSGN